MRVVVDLQSCQTGSRYRGIGRYSMSLLKAMIENPRGHEFVVVLNSAGSQWIESIRGELDGLLPQEQVKVWQQPPSASPSVPDSAWRRASAAILREAFIHGLRPDVVHVSSVFEGVADEAVVTINKFFGGAPVAVTHYDLIPHHYPDKYLPTDTMRRVYDARIQTLQRADRYLAISEYSGQELVETLNVDPSVVAGISAGVDPQFRKVDISWTEKKQFLGRLGLAENFVLYTGGGDSRKNVANLIRAYARLPNALRARHQLVIVSKMSEDEAVSLRRVVEETGVGQQVRIHDYISDDDLVHLYNLCSVFVLPSLHEGFGLPLLEAMSCGAPALGSNRTSIPEVLGRDHAMFDPEDVEQITARISAVLTDTDFANQLRKEGLAQAARFSWKQSAELALVEMEKLHAGAQAEQASLSRRSSEGESMGLAIIGLYERDLDSDQWREYLEQLSSHFPVSVVLDGRKLPPLSPSVDVIAKREYERRTTRYTHRLYRISGMPDDRWVRELALQYPGHISLDALFTGARRPGTPDIDARPGLREELYASCGYQPLVQLSAGKSEQELLEQFPCNRELLEASIAVSFSKAQDAAEATRWYGESLSRHRELFPTAMSPQPVSTYVHNVIGFLRESDARPSRAEIAQRLVDINVGVGPGGDDLAAVAECVVRNLPARPQQQQIFLDMTELIVSQAKSGIQRVVRAVAMELLQRDIPGFRVEPVYSVEDGSYRYAREHTLEMLGLANFVSLHDEAIEPRAGDIFLRLDLTLYGKDKELQRLRDSGVRVYELAYDLLPVKWPEHFVEGMPKAFHRWLDEAGRYADGVVCISRAVADELSEWLDGWQPQRPRPLKIGYFHLGADIESAAPTHGVSPQVEAVLNDTEATTFLMVGTIESRKGYGQVLDAFEVAWASGHQVRLVIVGRQGWLVESLVKRLQEHPESGHRLFWLHDISDEALLKLYEHSDALIMASVAEGFGLPLVEAARHGLPLIARDLPVFREVAGEGAFYFSGGSGASLAEALNHWMQMHERGEVPRPENVEILDWKQSVNQLLSVILDDGWYSEWLPNNRYVFGAVQEAVETRKGRIIGQNIRATKEGGLVMASRPFRLPAGEYRMTLRFDADQPVEEGSVWYDLSGGAGNDLMQTQRVANMQHVSGGVYQALVECPNDRQDLQFRLWASAGVDVAFKAVELLPLTNAATRDDAQSLLVGT